MFSSESTRIDSNRPESTSVYTLNRPLHTHLLCSRFCYTFVFLQAASCFPRSYCKILPRFFRCFRCTSVTASADAPHCLGVRAAQARQHLQPPLLYITCPGVYIQVSSGHNKSINFFDNLIIPVGIIKVIKYTRNLPSSK